MENQSVEHEKDKSLFSEQETNYKEYHYIRNGKDIIIKRKWTKSKNGKSKKQQELKEYFDNNKDRIKDMKIKDILEDYNKTHNKVNHATLSKYYAIYKAENEILLKYSFKD